MEAFLAEGSTLLAIEEEAKERALGYNRGVFHFYKGDYEQAQKYFHEILPGVKDIFYASDTRAYLLMCYFETGDTMAMESLVHSFRMFLTRGDKVSETHKESYLEFIRVSRRVLATPPKDVAPLQQLKADIEGLKLSAGKSWLLRKVSELGA